LYLPDAERCLEEAQPDLDRFRTITPPRRFFMTMNDSEQLMLDVRVARLESQSRTLRLLLFAVGAAISVLACQRLSKPRSTVLEVSRLVVRDEGGKTIVVLGTLPRELSAEKAWESGLGLYGENGQLRASLDMTAGDSPTLRLITPEGKERLLLSEGGLDLINKTGEKEISLSAAFGKDNPNSKTNMLSGGPYLSLSSGEKAGSPSVDLSIDHDGYPALNLWGPGPPGVVRASLHVEADGSSSLKLTDEDGKTRAALGSVSLVSTRTDSTEVRPPSSLVLFGRDGKVVFMAPSH
jgi:hypothetical protein